MFVTTLVTTSQYQIFEMIVKHFENSCRRRRLDFLDCCRARKNKIVLGQSQSEVEHDEKERNNCGEIIWIRYKYSNERERESERQGERERESPTERQA